MSKYKTKNNEFNYLADKLDIIDVRLDAVERVLELQEKNLAEHMRRTSLLEDQIDPLNKFMWAAYGIVAFVGVAVGVWAAIK